MTDFTYFDYAAATPIDPQVLTAMQPFFSDVFYNPSANYAPARQVAVDLEKARAGVAYWLGSRPAEVLFTAGGTEANNLAIHGIMRRYQTQPEAAKVNIVVSAIEHDAVLRPASLYNCRIAPVASDGLVKIPELQSKIDDNTVLVSIMYANNEIGTVQSIKNITQLVKDIRDVRRKQGNTLPLYVHTDACQAANYLDLHVARLGVDLMTLNGGKIYGPKQSGVLYVKAGIELEPLIAGGGQERGLRSGTENVAACVGLAMALDIAQTDRHTEQERMQKLQTLFINQLAEKLPQVIINGSLKKRLPNNVHITLPDQDNERLLLELESQGILAAAGSACSASSEEPSHVLRALGLNDADAQSSLRFTMGRATTEQDIVRTVDVLVELRIRE
jgi:cysteine desulfurase